MATIKFVNGSEKTFLSIQERMKTDSALAEWMKDVDDEDLLAMNFRHHDGGEDEPELFEVRMPSNTKVRPHAHRADEIIYVTEGEIHFGKQVYGVGSSVFIPKMTLYSFESGPQGLTFLNFRPVRSPIGLSKEQLMAERKAEGRPLP